MSAETRSGRRRPRWLSFLAAEWPLTTGLFLAIAVDVAASVGLALFFKEIFDVGLPRGDGDYLLKLIAGASGVVVVAGLALAAIAWFLAGLSAAVLSRLHREMYRSVETRSLSDARAVPAGELIQQFTGDMDTLEVVLSEGVPRAIRGLLLCLTCLVIMFVLEWRLTVGLLVTLGLLAMLPNLLAGRAREVSVERRAAGARFTAAMDEIVRGQTVIRAFQLDDFWRARFAQHQQELSDGVRRQILLGRMVLYITTLSSHVVTIVTVGFGAWLAHKGHLSPGALVGYLVLIMPLSRGIQNISGAAPFILRAIGGMQRIDELVGAGADDRGGPDAPLPALTEAFSVRSLSFTYPGDERPTIDQLELNIARGQSVAIVGSSGSGKSTLLSLLLGFQRPSAGDILWDGEPLANPRRTDGPANRHAHHLGVVFQSAQLFDLSVRENIRLGRLSATDDEVTTAANRAEAHGFVELLKSGYDTVVGPEGQNLSGGQRQRIALARALVRAPDVLVLDEPTASLDVSSEAAINATLEQLRVGRTVIHVTHRLDAIREYDTIVVLENGRLAESGTHGQLMAQGGRYHQMVEQRAGIDFSSDGRRARVTPERLRRIPLFESSSADDLKALAEAMETEHLPANHLVFERGDPGERFYLVARGLLDVFVQSPEPRIISQLSAGDFFGEIALLRDVARSASVRTTRPCVLLSISRRVFDELLLSHEHLRASLEQAAAARLVFDDMLSVQELLQSPDADEAAHAPAVEPE